MPAPQQTKVRFPRAKADRIVRKVEKHLKPFVDRQMACGSYRRGAQMIGDIDFVVIPKEGVTLPEMLPPNEGVNWVGDQKAQVIIDGEKVDFRVTTPDAWGATIMYFTGPADFNIKYRWMAKKRGMKLSEYGLFDRNTGAYIAGATEQDIYDAMGRPYRDPDQRTGWKRAESFEAPYQPDQTLADYTPQSLMTSSAITGDYTVDSLKYGFGPTSLSAEEFRSENRWITNQITALLSQRALTLKQIIDELGIRGITVEANLNRNPMFSRIGRKIPAIWGLSNMNYSHRHPYNAITPAEARQQRLRLLFQKLNRNEIDWDDVEWSDSNPRRSLDENWGDDVEWSAEMPEDPHERCPICFDYIPSNDNPGAHRGAMSRYDNETEICSRCGSAEAAVSASTATDLMRSPDIPESLTDPWARWCWQVIQVRRMMS